MALVNLPDRAHDLSRAARRRSGKKQNFSYSFDGAGAGAPAALVLPRTAMAWRAKLVQASADGSGAGAGIRQGCPREGGNADCNDGGGEGSKRLNILA